MVEPFQTKKRWYFRLLPLLILLGAAVAMILLLPRRPLLVVARGDGGGVLRRLPLGESGRFSIMFTHSHAKSPVEEVFTIDTEGGFRLGETLYADFGAGLPHEALPGQRMEFSDGRIRLTGYDTHFNELYVRVGRIADHWIEVHGGESLRLAEVAEPGSAVRITVQQ